MESHGNARKSYPTAENLITLCNLHLQLWSFLLYHVLNFRLYPHTCHANLTNQCLLNFTFSMTKVLDNRSSPKQNFHFLHLYIPFLPPVLFRKPCFYSCLSSSFSHSLFIKFQLTPLLLEFCGLSANQILGKNKWITNQWEKSYETSYLMT